MIKKVLIVLVFALIPLASSAQFLGAGAQYSDFKKVEFAANASYPFIHPKNPLNSYIASGIDYTGGKSYTSGLNIKPIMLTSFLSEDLFNNNKFTILVGCDGGYLFNFRNSDYNGFIVSPNLYFDYSFFFLKAGYDYNANHSKGQFFVRLGVGIGMGSFKSLVKTTIW